MNLKSFQNRLLDLSRTNNLINYKDRLHTSLSAMAPEPKKIFEALFNDQKLEVFNVDKYVSKFSGEKDLLKSNIEFEDIMPQIEKYVGKNELLLYRQGGSVNSVLKNLLKKGNDALLEKGLNILYMSFGMINYEEDNLFLKAPLVLVPIKIIPYAKSFKIALYEEEATLNPNFKYKLINEEKIKLNDISLDDDIEEYIDYVNTMLKPTGYYVSDDMYISLFSFNKINMYQDMVENEGTIKKHNIVRALLNDGEVVQREVLNFDADAKLVVDSDNTQSIAINAVRRGESIVLSGPPRTGKSQTITNLISRAIYDGKKVLFVSEKLAALNVVYDKLLKNNLGDFALALHSTKTNKKEVIRDLYETLFKEKTKTEQKAKLSLLDTEGLENILDDYAQTLHKKIDKYDLSPYEIFTNYSDTKTYSNDLEIRDSNLNKIYIDKVISLLNDYKAYLNILEYDYRKSPFYLIRRKAFTSSDIKKLKMCKDELTPILKNIVDIKKVYDLELITFDDYRVFKDSYNTFLNSKYYLKDFFKEKKINEYLNLTSQLIEDKKALEKSYVAASNVFDDEFFNSDIEGELNFFKRYKTKLFSFLRPKYRARIKRIRPYTKSKRINYSKLLAALTAAYDHKLFMNNFNERSKTIDVILGKNYDGYNTDFSNLYDMLRAIKNAYTIKGFKYIRLDKKFILEDSGINNLKELAGKEIYTIDTNTYDIKQLFKLINSSVTNYKLIDAYRLFETNVLNKLKDLNAISYLNYSLDMGYDVSCLSMPLLNKYYELIKDKVLLELPALKEFNNIVMDKMVSEFRELDNKRFEIYKSLIREKIQSRKPNPDAIATGSIASIIKREYLKKRRQMTVREIINSDPEFIKTLKPVFLMSPLSVSTYLTKDFHFDLVIFDEASQVYPEDAIGAIYRADQIVICGDSKQMPPTNFFRQSIDEDEDEGGDFESILDMAKTCLKVYSLKWHYRSQCEELIAFSNKYIYNDDLVTFPSAKAHQADFGIELYNVNGLYDKATRSNEIEADKVIELIDAHYKKYKNTRSIGVVAFSISQEKLIERKLASYLAKNEIIDNEAEPIFVKNLETVQGDERDTIIFSIGYGYDKDKRFVQNFGPLNRDGGERRLNVAITRAKVNVKVVSSVTAQDIADSKSLGPTLLKKYLLFAENPTISNLGENQNRPDFSAEVRDFLISEGYDVSYMVGFSKQKIEICIKDKNTNNYSIAIECDGNTYYNARLCRDRNRLRRQVLERMGFRYIRVYSTAWYKDNALAKKILLEEINKVSSSLDKMDKKEFMVSSDNIDTTFKEYIYSPDSKIIEAYKKAEISFEDVIKRILDNESPINESWLVSRFKEIFDPSSKLEDEYELLKAMYLNQNEIISKDGYLMYKDKPIEMRVPYEGGIPRDIKVISPLEIAYGMKLLLARNNGLLKDDLFKKVQKDLGYKRMNKQIEEKFEKALVELEKITILRKSDERLSVLDI